MFKFEVGKPMKVYRSGSFKKADDTEGAYVIMRECDNQPEGLERPSKSRKPIKIWLESLPAGIVNDGYVAFDKIVGGEWKSVPAVDIHGERMTDRFGNSIFNEELVLIVEGLKPVTVEPDKKKGA
ncbi:MAG: hypothetical protein J6T99_07135 [Oscillospiraceae bacterium]|nr:hypothetical protein [Oscillospiraceae bacterium]